MQTDQGVFKLKLCSCSPVMTHPDCHGAPWWAGQGHPANRKIKIKSMDETHATIENQWRTCIKRMHMIQCSVYDGRVHHLLQLMYGDLNTIFLQHVIPKFRIRGYFNNIKEAQ
jgi:hypothetical protein